MIRSTMTLIIAASFAQLMAVETTVSDLRLGVGVLSNNFSGSSSTTATSGGGTVTTSSSSDSGRDSSDNFRAQIQYVGGHLGEGGGIIWGIGIAANHARFDNGSQDATVTTPCVDVLIGYGYAFTPGWHFEIAPFIGAGRAYYSVTDNGQTSTSKEWSKYIEFGGKIGTYFTLGQSFQVGIEVPYLVGSFDPDYTYTNGANDQVRVSDNRENRGFGVLVTLGGRF